MGTLAGDWPQWRGPDRTGQVKETPGLPATPRGSLPMKWRVKAGEGFTSPVVAGPRG